MRAQLVVLAKQPRPGQVKTRLCPPCTPEQAAAVAAAALHDTLDAVDATPVAGRCLVATGQLSARPGWSVVPQRGAALGERIAHAFADTAVAGHVSALIGMDTPQVDPAVLSECIAELARVDAVLGPADDGGWWLLAVRDPHAVAAIAGVATSRPDTGALTHAALVAAGLRVGLAPTLRDVDTAADAWAVAAACRPDSVFVAAVAAHLPAPAARS